VPPKKKKINQRVEPEKGRDEGLDFEELQYLGKWLMTLDALNKY
jgi:hypothetical protein